MKARIQCCLMSFLVFAVAGTLSQAATTVQGTGPDNASTIASVVDLLPEKSNPQDLFCVIRADKPVAIGTLPVNLQAGDRIFIKTEYAIVKIRHLDSAKVIWRQGRRQNADCTGEDDYFLRPSPLPGLRGFLLTWWQLQLSKGREFPAGSGDRSVGDIACYNKDSLDFPQPFRIPLFGAEERLLVAGTRDLRVTWLGGVPPFTVTILNKDTRKALSQQLVQDACSAVLPRLDLTRGEYQLSVSSRNDRWLIEHIRVVDTKPPEKPPELVGGELAQNVSDLYYATWLTVIDSGRWRLEAFQRVSDMDCKSEAVEAWLANWGGIRPCTHK